MKPWTVVNPHKIETYFWSHIIRRAAERIGSSIQEYLQLAHSKVGNPDVSLEIQQHVIQLQISVNDSLLVKEYETWPDLGGIEPGSGFGKASALLDVEHEIATVQVLHHEEEMGFRLEGTE